MFSRRKKLRTIGLKSVSVQIENKIIVSDKVYFISKDWNTFYNGRMINENTAKNLWFVQFDNCTKTNRNI